jgi:hypothetical protein
MLDELHALLAKAIAIAVDVTDADAGWTRLSLDSAAGMEQAAEEARRPEPETGSWPWIAGLTIARWAIQVAAEEAKGFLAMLDRDATSYAADVLCRGVLETASLAWWLLDPTIEAKKRLARSLVYRLHTADQTAKAVNALELDPKEDRSGYGESVADVQQEIRDLGWAFDNSGPRVSFGADKDDAQRWLTYTERVAALIERIWPQRKLPYAALSAVAHAELLGLQRNLAPSRHGVPSRRPVGGPETVLWLWQDSYLVLGALVFAADRAASFLGLVDQLAALSALTEQLDQRLPLLRPRYAESAWQT